MVPQLQVITLRLGELLRPALRFRRIGFEALAVTAGQAAAAVGAVVGVRVLTEVMPPRAYGELALAMTVATLGLQVFLAPIATSAMRFFAPASESDELRGMLAAVRKLIVQAVAVVALMGLIGIAVLVARSQAHWVSLTIAAVFYTIFIGVATVLDGLQNAARHRVVAATHSGIAPWLRFLAAIALLQLAASASSAMAMTGYAAASAAVLLSQFYFFRKTIVPARGQASAEGAEKWRRSLLTYGLPFASWGIFTSAQLASDRWALGAFAGADDVGFYAVVYQLGYTPIVMASMLIGQVVAPVLFSRAGDATDAARVRSAVKLNVRIAGLMVILTLAGFGIALLVHPLIGRLLLAAEYRGVTYLLPWMVVGGGLFATGQVGALFFLITNRSSALTAPKIGSAILGVILNVAGALWFGVTGVVAAVIAAALFYCLWMMIIALRTYRKATAPGAGIMPADAS